MQYAHALLSLLPTDDLPCQFRSKDRHSDVCDLVSVVIPFACMKSVTATRWVDRNA